MSIRFDSLFSNKKSQLYKLGIIAVLFLVFLGVFLVAHFALAAGEPSGAVVNPKSSDWSKENGDLIFGVDYVSKDVGFFEGTFVFKATNPTNKVMTVSYSFIELSNSITDYVVEYKVPDSVPIINYSLICKETWDDINKSVSYNDCKEDGKVIGYFDGWASQVDKHVLVLQPLESKDVKITARWKTSSLKERVYIDVVPHVSYTKDDSSKVDLAQTEWTLWDSSLNNLVNYWQFNNNGSDIADSVSQGGADNILLNNGSDLTFESSANCVADACIQAVVDSSNTYLTYVDNNSNFMQNTSFTLCANIKSPYAVTGMVTFFGTGGAYNDYGTDARISNAGAGEEGIRITKTGIAQTIIYDNITDAAVGNTWAFFCIRFDQSNFMVEWWKDGVPSGATSLGQDGYYVPTNRNIRFGFSQDWGAQIFDDMWLDEVSFWNKSLTDEELVEINSTSGVFSVQYPLPSNIAPSNPSVSLSPLDSFKDVDAYCVGSVNDSDVGDTLTVDVEVFKNNVSQFLLINNPATNNVHYNFTIDSANFSVGDEWGCGMRVNDQTVYSDWANNTQNTIIQNSLPFIVTLSLNNSVSAIAEDGGEQPLASSGDFNVSVYFMDVDNNQTPANVSVNTNETDVSCSVKANFSFFCTPSNNFTGSSGQFPFDITLNYTDQDNAQVEESFLGFVNAVNDPPTAYNIYYNTTQGATSGFLYNQKLDMFSFDCQDFVESDEIVSASVSLSNGGVHLDNASASLVSGTLWKYDDDVQMNGAGTWTVNYSCVDVNGATGSDTTTFDVAIQNVSIKDGWYGYKLNEASSSDLDSEYTYGVDITESNVSIKDSLKASWNSTHIPSVSEAYNLSTRFAFNLVFDYDACNDANMEDARANINDTIPDLLGDPYSITVAYISIETPESCSASDRENVADNLSVSLVDMINNRFPVYSTNLNSSTFDTAYIRFTPLLYVKTSNHEDWVNQEYVTMFTNTSLNRIYDLSGANASLKSDIQYFQERVMDILPSIPKATLITSDNMTAELSNGDVVVFNSQASNRTIGVDVSSVASIIGKDVWDASNKEVPELDTDGKFEVNVTNYGATVLLFEDMTSIRYDASNNLAFAYSGGSSETRTFNYSGDGSVSNSFGLYGANDFKIELFDPFYKKNTAMVYYGLIPDAYLNFTSDEIGDYNNIIVANQTFTWVDIFNMIALNGFATKLFGYMSLVDYADTDAWELGKEQTIDEWIGYNESFNVFKNGFDAGASGNNFETRAKNLIDYTQIIKGVLSMLNTYTTYEIFSTMGQGGVMRESCLKRWDGTSPDYVYTWEEKSLTLNKSQFDQTHNIPTLCQAFDYQDAGANLYYLANYSEAVAVYLGGKVIGYDDIYISTPLFNNVEFLYFPDVGTDLQNSFSVSDSDENYIFRRFSNGIAWHNFTSNESGFDNGRSINSATLTFMLYKNQPSNADKSLDFSINKDVDAGSSGDYSIPMDSPVDAYPNFTWFPVDVELSASDIANSNGRYIVEGWVMPRGTMIGQGINLANSIVDGESAHSWYDQSSPDVFNSYGKGKNWLINITVNQTITTAFDSMITINQSVTPLLNNRFNISLDSGSSSYPVEVWSGVVSQSGFTFGNLTYEGVDLKPINSSLCDSNNPDWASTVVGSETFKSCFKDSDGIFEVRVVPPSLSERVFELTGGNTPPLFEPIGDFSLDEDFGSFSIDLTANISDLEDADSNLGISYELNDSTIIAVDIVNATSNMTYTSLANMSGSVNITTHLVDTGGLENITSHVLTVNQINDVPWWDDMTNGSVSITEDTAANVTLGWRDSWWDVEENHAPTQWDVFSNSSDCPCQRNVTGDIGCQPTNNLTGNVILIISAEDGSTVNITASVEITINNVNDAPMVPELNTPLNASSLLNPSNFVFTWSNSTDIENNPISYIFEIMNSSFDTIYYNESIVETINTTQEENISSIGLTYGGYYFWRVLANDSSNSSWSEVRGFNYLIGPELVVVKPVDSASYNFQFPIEISAVAGIQPIDTVWYEVPGSVVNTTFTGNTTVSLSEGDYYFIAFANDSSGNIIQSSTVSFKMISSTSPPSGGGGGGSAPEYCGDSSCNDGETDESCPEDCELVGEESFINLLPRFDINLDLRSSGSVIGIAKGEFISFTFNSFTRHSVTVKDIKEDVVTFEVASDPVVLDVKFGEGGKVDLNNDGVNDIMIVIDKIEDGLVSFTIYKDEGFLKVAKEDTVVKLSPLAKKYTFPVIIILLLIAFGTVWDFKKKRVRFFGLVITMIMTLALLLESWKGFFSLIGWAVVKDSFYPAILGFILIFLFWLLIYIFLFRKKRRKL